MLKVSLGRLKLTCDTRVIHFEALAWMKKKRSLRNEKLKANRASETEEPRKEMLRITHENDRARRITKKNTRGKEKVIRNRKPRETAPGHSQKIEARCRQ